MVKNRVNRKLLKLATRKLRDVVNALPEPWEQNVTGRHGHDSGVVVILLCLMEMFGYTYDEAESVLCTDQRIKRILNVRKLPGHSVLHRGKKRLSQTYLRKLNYGLTRAFREDARVILDSTGLRLLNSSSWYDIRIQRENRRKDNEKLHLSCSPDSGVIFDYRITGWKRHDSPFLKTLLSTLKRIKAAFGDAGYLSRKNCAIVAQKGGTPFFHPKKNTTKKPKGVRAWKDMIAAYRNDAASWLAAYYIRSYIEAVISSIKKCFGSTVRSVKKRMQRKEIALKVICYNIKQVLYNEVARKIKVSLWVNP